MAHHCAREGDSRHILLRGGLGVLGRVDTLEHRAYRADDLFTDVLSLCFHMATQGVSARPSQ